MTRLWPVLWGVACSGATTLPPPTDDADGDGWSVADGDCDDADGAIHPAAEDLPDDGVDQDCDGEDATVGAAITLDPGDLVITEIQFDPQAVDGDFGEWFEVLNASDDPIDLWGLEVRDDSGDGLVLAEHHVVEPGAYAVLGRSTDAAINGGAPVDLAYGDALKLGNDGDAVRLLAGEVLVDEVVYDETAGFPFEDGAALSLSPEHLSTDDNDAGEAWCAALTPYGDGDLGTPGQANPPCEVPALTVDELLVGDLIVTEFLADPAEVGGDVGEWFEVRNTTGQPIELLGLVLHDDGGDELVLDAPYEVAPGALVVFGASDDLDENGGAPVDIVFGDAMKLAGGDDEIVLETPAGLEIDRIVYDSDWPIVEGEAASLDPSAEGASLNDDPDAWCPADDEFGDGDKGTPGEDNPPCP